MKNRILLAGACLLALVAVVWLAFALFPPSPPLGDGPYWMLVKSWGHYTLSRSDTAPAAYLISDGTTGVMIDCPEDVPLPRETAGKVFLTHAHRDSVGGVEKLQRHGWQVFAPKASEEWLSRENVAKFWKESIPLRNSRSYYFVHPTGFDDVSYTVTDRGNFTVVDKLELTAFAMSGHGPDHTSYSCAAQHFLGDAATDDGKLWTPFTTDWDHWQDVGLKPAEESAKSLFEPVGAGIQEELRFARPAPARATFDAKTAFTNIHTAAFHKSFERFTNKLGDVPKYDFLVPKEQVGSNGSQPWAKVSASLWITGNTYVLKSKKSGGCLVLDPWGQRAVDQVAKLREAEKIGPVELAMFSHAHFDHFDGVYTLPEQGKYEVWALDTVAGPIADPLKVRAPFLDERPVKFTRTLKDGETATWQEYTFRFHHLPGQTYYTSGIEAEIDGKKCLFTADNFFHYTQYSGSGGWMGLNRSSPLMYAASARKVLDLKPEWVLAEHGGPFAFDAEDFRRRVKWGEAAAKACDAVCVTGDHRRDWNPHAVSVEPVLAKAKAGDTVKATLRVAPNIGPVKVVFRGRGVVPDQTWQFANGGVEQVKEFSVTLPPDLPTGRHVFAVSPLDARGEFADPFFAVDVGATAR